MVHRASHKLALKFYGPYLIIAKIGDVAYRLELPYSNRIHTAFHSQLKKYIPPVVQVQTSLPPVDSEFQIPPQVL